MTFQIALLFTIIILGVILFISEKLRPDLIALIMLLILALTGLVTTHEAFSGLSSPAVILLISVYILTGALFRTGVSAAIGRWLVRAAGQSEVRLVALVMLAAGSLSLFMNNIASGAVLMPAIMDVSRRTKVSAARLLIPMAFATQLGGMATLFTTSNLVASVILEEAGYRGFHMLDFVSVGGPAALAGIAFMVFFGRNLLPKRSPREDQNRPEEIGLDLVSFYHIRERLHEVRLGKGSPVAGKTLAETGIGSQLGLTVMAIERDGRFLQDPAPSQKLQSRDILLISGRSEKVSKLSEWGATVSPAIQWPAGRQAGRVEMLEVIPSPHSAALGQSIRQYKFRSKFGLNVLALWHNGESFRTGFGDFPLQNSDVLLVHGPQSSFKILENDPDWLVLRTGEPQTLRRNRMWLAVGILAVSLVAALLLPLPIHFVLFVGGLAVVLTGCLTMDEAYRAIDWRSVILVGGMLPVGIALNNSGAAGLLGEVITRTLGSLGPMVVAAGLFLITSALNQFIPGGSAVPAVLTPIAIAAARSLGADPRGFALVIAIATGTSLLTPFAHPVNVLVMGPGGYRFRDYLRAGLPLVIITMLVTLLLLPVFWRV